MKADVLLRSATAADVSAIAEVLIQSRAAYLPFAPSAHPPDDVRGYVAEQLVPSGGVCVSEQQGTVVGVVATSHIEGVSWIDQMYVRPGWLSQGVGSQMLAHAHRVLARPIRLYTFQANTRARCFYERYGYTAVEFTDGQTNEEHCPDVLYELG